MKIQIKYLALFLLLICLSPILFPGCAGVINGISGAEIRVDPITGHPSYAANAITIDDWKKIQLILQQKKINDIASINAVKSNEKYLVDDVGRFYVILDNPASCNQDYVMTDDCGEIIASGTLKPHTNKGIYVPAGFASVSWKPWRMDGWNPCPPKRKPVSINPASADYLDILCHQFWHGYTDGTNPE